MLFRAAMVRCGGVWPWLRSGIGDGLIVGAPAFLILLDWVPGFTLGLFLWRAVQEFGGQKVAGSLEVFEGQTCAQGQHKEDENQERLERVAVFLKCRLGSLGVGCTRR